MLTKEEYENFCSILNGPRYPGPFKKGSGLYYQLETIKIQVKEYEEFMDKDHEQVFQNKVPSINGDHK